MATKNAKTNTNKKEFNMEQAFALWKRKGKSGKTFFTGPAIVGFYNGKKKNPKEPDLRVCINSKSDEGYGIGDEVGALWLHTKEDKQWFFGEYNKKRVVGFINKKGNEKAPYISVYYREDEEPSANEKTNETPVEHDADGDLPF